MSVVVVVTAFPIPEHRAEVVAAFEEAIARVHDEPGVELYALHEGRPAGNDREVRVRAGALGASQGRGPRRPAGCFGRQAQQRSRPAGPRTAPGRRPAEGRAVTARP